MNILIIDNYDSFTYNLYQYMGEVLQAAQSAGDIGDFKVMVKRNDELDLESIQQLKPDRIVISPGPGSPDDPAYFGICAQVIKELGKTIPTLGVCLGMQGIVHVFGGRIVKAALPMHGKVSAIKHHDSGLFRNLPVPLEVMRYHSLVAEPASFPDELEITAFYRDEHGDQCADKALPLDSELEIMGVKHRHYPIFGIQFHPESFATEAGKELLANFLFN